MEEKVLNIITVIRASFGASISVYTMGNCYQFYEILKTIFPDAVAYESGGHVVTKIDNEFYDIKGKYDKTKYDFLLVEQHRLESLTANRWSDERRKEYSMVLIKKIDFV